MHKFLYRKFYNYTNSHVGDEPRHILDIKDIIKAGGEFGVIEVKRAQVGSTYRIVVNTETSSQTFFGVFYNKYAKRDAEKIKEISEK